MSSINKVILVGNLGGDPVSAVMGNGKAVANITLATGYSWTDTDGNKQEKTEWHRVVFFDRMAEVVTEFLKKGKQVYIEGRLETRKWEDKSGETRYTTEIVATDMQMLGTK